jgi:hypothetical protein
MSRVIRIRGHHIESVLRYFNLRDNGSLDDPYEVLRRHGYGEEYISNKRALLERMYSDPDQKVKIIATLDDFCKACTEKKNKDCSNLMFQDAWYAGMYEFSVTQKYAAKDFHHRGVFPDKLYLLR